MKKKLLVLYSEIMPYAISVIQALNEISTYEVYVVYWDKKKRTPFLPSNLSNIHLLPKSKFNQKWGESIIEDSDFSVVWVSGRMDKDYLRFASKFRNSNSILVIAGIDAQWQGTFKDYIKVLGAYFLYRKYFNALWVPGPKQREFAEKLGFNSDSIIDNLLSGDVESFEKTRPSFESTNQVFRFLYVGRLVEVKGLKLLVECIEKLRAASSKDIELVTIGSGPLEQELKQPWIRNRGFLSQSDMQQEVQQAHCFCLPSISEPFGVVLHEMTSAGLPVICSDVCGARYNYVKHGVNGFVFKSNRGGSLLLMLRRMVGLSKVELLTMSNYSKMFSKNTSPRIAAKSFLGFVENYEI